MLEQRAAPLAQETAHPVSLHRPSHLLAHHEPELSLQFRVRQSVDDEETVRPRAAAPVNGLEAAILPEAQLAGKHSLDGQPVTPLGSPGCEHVAAVQGTHAPAEAVGPLPPAVMRLKSSLHALTSKKNGQL